MKKKIILLGFMIAFPFAAIASTPEDQYKQMGGISGIAEACLGETELGYALTESLLTHVINNPGSISSIGTLYNVYANSYNKASNDFKIWIGSKQIYSETAFDCNKEEDMNLIKQFSSSMTQNLRSGSTVSD
jgi:hypothetical protein